MTLSAGCREKQPHLLIQPDTRKLALGCLGLASYVQTPIIPDNLPKPEFVFGDKVSDNWVDEFGENRTEFGEVLGICWYPRQKTWAYLIEWTGGAMEFEPESHPCYPCFDGNLVVGGDLRLASHD
ncbi:MULTISPECIES: hypothetical protein [unclassified Microcoleus]|uniref:hypothetical protein n=1 Tax=unclassified Microcoleus TaxID=2642155 RepID=UPI0025FE4BF4|nr:MULTISPECIES: hypothetical protein [unclassified Microcoleus]